jgi:hypothetical protein
MPDNLLLADDEAAVLEVPVRLTAAWTEHDGDAVAAVCTEEDDMILPGDVRLTSIRATWVPVKRDSEWLIASYQNTPVGAA